MEISKNFEVLIKISINNSLYKKNIIDEQTFSIANEKLLKLLKNG